MAGSILGSAVKRVEDPRFLTGEAQYTADLAFDGLCAAFVRSVFAHARITSVTAPEGVTMLTAADLGMKPLRALGRRTPAGMERPPLADGVVRFVGDPVAIVLPPTQAEAADAAALVEVDYEPLDAIVDPADPRAQVALTVDPLETPDVFDDAEVSVAGRFINQRLAPSPMETHAILATPTGDGLVVHASTQHPFGMRAAIAKATGLDAGDIRVVAPAVGGGFGAKIDAAAEHLVVCVTALKVGAPVRYMETRSESLVAMTHGRGQIQEVEIGAKRDGTITGLRVNIIGEAGAYPADGAFLPTLTKTMASGVYDIPKIDFRAVSVQTNTTPTHAYRGAGRPEAAAMVERIVDMLAASLQMDPAELRRRNFIRTFPHTTVVGTEYDIGDYDAALDEALRVAGYDDLRAAQATRRESGDPKQLGIGISTYVEITGGSPADEFGSVQVHQDGTVTVRTGTSPHGQGHETAWAQIAASLLGVDMSVVRVEHSDTGIVARGHGTYGSRSAQTGGTAVYKAAEAVVEEGRRRAANMLEIADEDVVFSDGVFSIAGAPTRSVSWASLAESAPLVAELDFTADGATFPFGAHISVVEVDTETGDVELLRHIAVDDCGTIINPMLVDGQVHGGTAQGISQALYEQVLFDEDGNPLTATFADYAFPAASDLPAFEVSHTQTPTPLNPLGAKGIGESGTIGSTPAVQNAVCDAVRHLGVRHIDMPLTPERVWRAIEDARRDD